MALRYDSTWESSTINHSQFRCHRRFFLWDLHNNLLNTCPWNNKSDEDVTISASCLNKVQWTFLGQMSDSSTNIMIQICMSYLCNITDKIEQQMTSSNLKWWCWKEMWWCHHLSTYDNQPEITPHVKRTFLVEFEPTTFGEHDQCSYRWATGVFHMGIAREKH
jgi:hypothetical protein